MCIANHFRNKILCSQRNGHIIQILGRIPRKKQLFRGDFFVRRKDHARVRSIFSDQAMVLEDLSHIRYRWSYLAKQVLHFKLH